MNDHLEFSRWRVMYAFALTILGADGQQCERELAVTADRLVLPGAARDRVRTGLVGLRQARLRVERFRSALAVLEADLERAIAEHELRGGVAHGIDFGGPRKG